jgi:uncharacterized repeat protein (TIGR03803 family)
MLSFVNGWERCVLWICLLSTITIPGVQGQFQHQKLRSFGFPEQSGLGPRGLTLGSDGKWYGATRGGGHDDEWGNGVGSGTVFRLNDDGSGYTVLHIFSRAPGEGFGPFAPVIEGSDGALYGTTFQGGATDESSEGGGTIFKIAKDGSDYTVLHRFRYGHRDGYEVYAPLLEGSDGAFYGVTRNGGAYTAEVSSGRGTVFKINKDGSGHTVLHRFAEFRDGQWPETSLVEGSNGVLYGATRSGGFSVAGFYDGLGVAFKLNKDGTDYTVLHRFTRAGGALPSALIEASDGALYGTAIHGGFISQTNNVSNPMLGMGVVFRLQKDGSGYSIIHRFSDVRGEGRSPLGPLMESDGVLYGTTFDGGEEFNFGAVFRLNKDGSDYRVLATLPDGVGNILNGDFAPMAVGRDGALYWAYGAAAFKLDKDGGGFNELHRFSYSGGDGRFPGPLIEGSDGALYGATATHRATGGGTVFRVNKDGSGYRILYTVPGEGFGPDEGYFNSNTFALLEGQDGALYGTMKNTDSVGAAFVFRLNKDGSGFTKLHSFDYTGEGHDTLELMQTSDGVLYGSVLGNLFKLNTDGTGYTVLPLTEGIGPIGVLTEASDGALYGMGFTNGFRDHLVLFRINKINNDYTVLRAFGGYGVPWWQEPRAPLIENRDGVLFGSTSRGGTNTLGTLFRINKDGTDHRILYHFDASLSLVGNDGAIYGLTPSGGVHQRGSIFRIAADGGGFIEPYSFRGPDGEMPVRLLQGSDGAFYGTTKHGGTLNLGTIFALRPKAVFIAPSLSPAGVTVRITSMPNSAHQLQRASLPGGPWQTLANLVISADGMAQWVETGPRLSAAFYRTITSQ